MGAFQFFAFLELKYLKLTKKERWAENPAGRRTGSGWELMDFLDFFAAAALLLFSSRKKVKNVR